MKRRRTRYRRCPCMASDASTEGAIAMPPFEVKTGDVMQAVMHDRRFTVRVEQVWVNLDGEPFVEFSYRPNILPGRERLVWDMDDFREIVLLRFGV